jgi:hypothetical protein
MILVAAVEGERVYRVADVFAKIQCLYSELTNTDTVLMSSSCRCSQRFLLLANVIAFRIILQQLQVYDLEQGSSTRGPASHMWPAEPFAVARRPF